MNRQTIHAARDRVHALVRARQSPDGGWEGRLSSSAVSTAVAGFALHGIDAARHRAAVHDALGWLAADQQPDGGWGDSPDGPSNLTATLLAWAALSAGSESHCTAASTRAEGYIGTAAGSLAPEAIVRAVTADYGDDRTFATPILSMLALAGRLGEEPGAWNLVPPLPFEAALLPPSFYRMIRLDVVSYALPALIAVGLLPHRRGAPAFSLRRRFREAIIPGLLDRMRRLQPGGGGFLEAAPLTGFVAMSLAAAGLGDTDIVRRAEGFLLDTRRPDGAWPIDTHLATWNTSLAVRALYAGGPGLEATAKTRTRAWLLAQQHRQRHPYTGAEPGGWAWTPLSGGVPDADDTAGALIALRMLMPGDRRAGDDPEVFRAAATGLTWLMRLQNRDGGLPTFCRGWGRLPFDRSCPDLTAHALAAWRAWQPAMPPPVQAVLERAARRALAYLGRAQHPDGSWLPLWFGNPLAERGENPLYGTARVLLGLEGLTRHSPETGERYRRGVQWLLRAQAEDGGWGGGAGAPSSVEETALALDALANAAPREALESGFRWLESRTEGFTAFPPAPIGLYFARLRYTEDLYPMIFTAAALGRIA